MGSGKGGPPKLGNIGNLTPARIDAIRRGKRKPSLADVAAAARPLGLLS
jgi:hypothetical protein